MSIIGNDLIKKYITINKIIIVYYYNEGRNSNIFTYYFLTEMTLNKILKEDDYMNFGMNNMPTGGYYGGMMYQEPPKLAMTQGLTKEEINALSKNSAFTLEISKEDLWRAFCTHRYENKFAVAQDDEGNFVCALCGTKFTPYSGEVA